MRFTSGTSRRAPWLRPAAALLLAGAFVACDDDAAGPDGDDAEVEAFIIDDPTSASPSVASASAIAAAVITGSASGDARVDISVDGSEWIELGSMNSVDLALQSSTPVESVSGEAEVPAGTYTRVRLVLEGAEAEIEAGSDIGGVVLGVDTTLTLGDGDQVIVERVVQFEVTAGARARIVFDLNSEQWITQATLAAGTVSEAQIDASVAAAVHMETE